MTDRRAESAWQSGVVQGAIVMSWVAALVLAFAGAPWWVVPLLMFAPLGVVFLLELGRKP